MTQKQLVAEQTLQTGGLYRCCSQSWGDQISRALQSGDRQVVCASCKATIIQDSDGKTWRWGETKLKQKAKGGTS